MDTKYNIVTNYSEDRGIFFQKINVFMNIGVHNNELDNITSAIHTNLSQYIGEYIKILRGVVIGYTPEIGILQEAGTIIESDSKVYFKVSVEFIVLRIILKCKSIGTVEDRVEDTPPYTLLSSYNIIPVHVYTNDTLSGVVEYYIKYISLYPLYIEGVLK
ncbi:hypothetical protein NEOKW01_0228 [Nematocida sp. AWRm80]|nr:hypothetical protein NEOKW01_0228 [Nematocida sp. AWRm80]